VGTPPLDSAEFYRKSADECLRTVLVSVGDLDAAQDLVNEAFARAWASWRTVSRHPAPTAWVIRVALNANISRWRRRRREVPVPDPDLIADLPAAAEGAGEAAGGTVDPRIMAALMRLPARQRQVIALRLILDLDTNATQPYPPSCQPYPASRATLQKAFPSNRDNPLAAVVIRPSALPAGAAVYINDSSNSYGYIGLHTGLVRASQQCTSS
jgi:DNA-directed RNA polymerase specialized sigma24 family protein